MEDTESTTTDRTTGNDGNQEADHRVLMSSKPLHRFVQREPRSLGIAILVCGCAEVLMGFQLASEHVESSCVIYTPFLQGALFLLCGSLSIYTEVHPSKKMVTVCLSMYVVSLLGIVVSICYRIQCFEHYGYLKHSQYYDHEWGHNKHSQYDHEWAHNRIDQLVGIEGILFMSSLCVSVILIFLCVIARLALKSTRSQVIVQLIPPPKTDTTST